MGSLDNGYFAKKILEIEKNIDILLNLQIYNISNFI
jgi:hypothetical protein